MADPITIMMFLSLLSEKGRGGAQAPYARSSAQPGQAGPPGPPGGGHGMPSPVTPSADPVGDAAQSAAIAADAAAQTDHPAAHAAASVAAQAADNAAASPDPTTAQVHANTAAAAAQQAVAVAKQTAPASLPPDSGANAPLLPLPAPVAVAPAPAPAVLPGAAPSMPPWSTSVVPSTLPPFPGPGWTPDTPVASSVANRAQYWNPQLWNFAEKQIVKAFVQEQFGGRWLTFVAAWHPDSDGNPVVMATEAWRLTKDTPAADAAGPSVPSPDQQAAVQSAAAATTPAPAPAAKPRTAPGQQGPLATSSVDNPVPVSPYPGPGAWQNNPGYIARYQAALTNLGFDTQGVDGRYGPHTEAAVKAFQSAHGLTADGQAGAQTAAAIDAALSGAGAGTADTLDVSTKTPGDLPDPNS